MHAIDTDRLARLFRNARPFALIAAALVLLGFAAPAFAQTAGDGRSWGAFFGRTHVLFLHLPIGLLIGAFALEVFGFFTRSRGYDVAAAWLFVLGFLSSIGAVVTGLLLGTEQATDKSLNAFTLLFADADQGVSDTLSLHMWLGTTLMVVAGLAAVLKVAAVRRQWKDKETSIPERGGLPLGLARVSLVGVMVAMPFVGHLGGNMTHGQDYLTERAPSEALVSAINLLNAGTTEKVETVEPVLVTGEDGVEVQVVNGTAAFWNAKIQPVMNQHCTACHNATKQNGNLRLDTLEWAMKGGSMAGSDNLIPFDYELNSEMYRRLVLPHSHDEHMPTNKKKYGIVAEKNIHMLGEWLMNFDGKLDSGEAPERVVKEDETEPGEAEDKPAIDPAAIKAITDAGGTANSLSLADTNLTVKFAYLKDLSADSIIELEPIADRIAQLTFEGASLDDSAASDLPDMALLSTLNLKDTKVTDTGVKNLPQMPALTWLNLFGTDVTDDALDSLARYQTLEKLYLTGTKVTAQGVEALREKMPETQIYSDHDGLFTFPDLPEPPKPGEKAEPAKPAEPAADQAAADDAEKKPVNTKCPVTGAPVKTGFVSTFEGKLVGFCCGGCKGKFDADPAKFKDKIVAAPAQ